MVRNRDLGAGRVELRTWDIEGPLVEAGTEWARIVEELARAAAGQDTLEVLRFSVPESRDVVDALEETGRALWREVGLLD